MKHILNKENILLFNYANKQDGIILLTVLLFMQIFMMIGIYAMQSGFLMQMTTATFNKNMLRMQKAEEVLFNIEQTNPIQRCLIAAISREELISQPIEWWLQTGCQGKIEKYQYVYLFELLPEDPCAYLNTNEKGRSAYYYRVTLQIFSDKNRNDKQILQSTIIKMDNAKQICTGIFHQIVAGRQSWRILN